MLQQPSTRRQGEPRTFHFSSLISIPPSLPHSSHIRACLSVSLSLHYFTPFLQFSHPSLSALSSSALIGSRLATELFLPTQHSTVGDDNTHTIPLTPPSPSILPPPLSPQPHSSGLQSRKELVLKRGSLAHQEFLSKTSPKHSTEQDRNPVMRRSEL